MPPHVEACGLSYKGAKTHCWHAALRRLIAVKLPGRRASLFAPGVASWPPPTTVIEQSHKKVIAMRLAVALCTNVMLHGCQQATALAALQQHECKHATSEKQLILPSIERLSALLLPMPMCYM